MVWLCCMPRALEWRAGEMGNRRVKPRGDFHDDITCRRHEHYDPSLHPSYNYSQISINFPNILKMF